MLIVLQVYYTLVYYEHGTIMFMMFIGTARDRPEVPQASIE